MQISKGANMDKIITGLRGATIKINANFNASDVYLHDGKFVVVSIGKPSEGTFLSSFKVGRIATNKRYTMQEVAGYLQTGLIASGYVGYKIQ
jgi:hypothetical protein